MKKFIFFCIFGLALCRVRYDGYKLISVIPQNKEDLQELNSLQSNFPLLDFWTEPNMINVPVDIMIPPAFPLSNFIGKEFVILDDNVQQYMDEMFNDLSKKTSFDLNNYNSLEEIEQWLLSLPRKCPSHLSCSVQNAGFSYEGRPILLFRMHEPGAVKGAHWIDATMHAREWIGLMSVVNFMDRLVTQYHHDAEAQFLADNFDWYFMPVANPDGYVYSYEEDGQWRKNRRFVEPNPLNCTGVDINRNFDWKWGTDGASANHCSLGYRGPYAESEPETQVYQRISALVGHHVISWTTVHAYGYYWLLPFGTKEDGVCQRSSYYHDLMRVANVAAIAVELTNDTTWTRGPICEVLYEASGSSIDYLHAIRGIKYAYSPELRGRHFQPPKEEIAPSSKEFWNGILAQVMEIELLEA